MSLMSSNSYEIYEEFTSITLVKLVELFRIEVKSSIPSILLIHFSATPHALTTPMDVHSSQPIDYISVDSADFVEGSSVTYE